MRVKCRGGQDEEDVQYGLNPGEESTLAYIQNSVRVSVSVKTDQMSNCRG